MSEIKLYKSSFRKRGGIILNHKERKALMVDNNELSPDEAASHKYNIRKKAANIDQYLVKFLRDFRNIIEFMNAENTTKYDAYEGRSKEEIKESVFDVMKEEYHLALSTVRQSKQVEIARKIIGMACFPGESSDFPKTHQDVEDTLKEYKEDVAEIEEDLFGEDIRAIEWQGLKDVLGEVVECELTFNMKTNGEIITLPTKIREKYSSDELKEMPREERRECLFEIIPELEELDKKASLRKKVTHRKGENNIDRYSVFKALSENSIEKKDGEYARIVKIISDYEEKDLNLEGTSYTSIGSGNGKRISGLASIASRICDFFEEEGLVKVVDGKIQLTDEGKLVAEDLEGIDFGSEGD